MGDDRRQLRGTVLAEDRRTERFIRHLLEVCGFDKRKFATPVPTWAIENWLLDLLGEPNINEDRRPNTEAGPTWKQVFDRTYANDERLALTEAATQWSVADPRLPSLEDGRVEFQRIAQ